MATSTLQRKVAALAAASNGHKLALEKSYNASCGGGTASGGLVLPVHPSELDGCMAKVLSEWKASLSDQLSADAAADANKALEGWHRGTTGRNVALCLQSLSDGASAPAKLPACAAPPHDSTDPRVVEKANSAKAKGDGASAADARAKGEGGASLSEGSGTSDAEGATPAQAADGEQISLVGETNAEADPNAARRKLFALATAAIFGVVFMGSRWRGRVGRRRRAPTEDTVFGYSDSSDGAAGSGSETYTYKEV